MRVVRSAVAAICAVLLSALVVIVGGIGPAGAAENNRVMPLGDSITDGLNVPGGYRIGLWQRLVASGRTVDFVGSLTNGPSTLGDRNHEGHSGWRIDQLTSNIDAWIRTYDPRTVLLHIGTNDIAQNTDLPNAPARLGTLIDRITAGAPNADVFVATIIPLPFAQAQVNQYNNAIPGLVRARADAGKRVHLVEMRNALTSSDLADGVHPNATGYDKMAAVWYSALLSVPGSLPGDTPSTPPSGSPSTPPPGSPSTPPSGSPSAPPPSGVCTARYVLAGQWSNGFQATVTVTATEALTGWTVTWPAGAGVTVTNSWGATITTTGSSMTAANVAYNGNVRAGTSVEFGFVATSSSAPGVPEAVCTGR
jgi:lysophospholipase L1-like esterase